MGDGEVNEKLDRVRAAASKKRARRLAVTAVLLIAAAAMVTAVFYGVRASRQNLPGQSYPDAGRPHIPLGAIPKRPYTSNPPSSGGHYAFPANWGTYDYEVNDQIILHNLEHGGVWISYKPNTAPPAAVSELKTMVDGFKSSKLVMSPRLADDSDIAVAAWTRVLKINLKNGALASEDKKIIADFYRAFKNKGPEYVPDSLGGIDPKTVQ